MGQQKVSEQVKDAGQQAKEAHLAKLALQQEKKRQREEEEIQAMIGRSKHLRNWMKVGQGRATVAPSKAVLARDVRDIRGEHTGRSSVVLAKHLQCCQAPSFRCNPCFPE